MNENIAGDIFEMITKAKEKILMNSIKIEFRLFFSFVYNKKG